MKKFRVGILGATGMVGHRFITLLDKHPWFEVVCLAASSRSAGKTYKEAVNGRWSMDIPIPSAISNIRVKSVEDDKEEIANTVDLVFCALDMDKDGVRSIEEWYAKNDVVVISNNSAHRWTEDVPMIIPEVNSEHANLIDIQRKNRNWNKGFIAVKSNCSIQSYIPPLFALANFKPKEVVVSTYQAISGAGKTFESWPEMKDNIIPFIGGEEEKSEREPLKVLGEIRDGSLQLATEPKISAQCIRVPVVDGHMAAVRVSFEDKPSKEQIIDAWNKWKNPIDHLKLPSSPEQFLRYFEEVDRPQTRIDRNHGNGMSITIGRLQEDNIHDWKFVGLSHNTIRGAAGGAILLAELLTAKGYIV